MQRASLGAPAVPSGRLSPRGTLSPGSSNDRKRMGRGSFNSSSAWVPIGQGAAMAFQMALRNCVVQALGREGGQMLRPRGGDGPGIHDGSLSCEEERQTSHLGGYGPSQAMLGTE